MKLTRKGAISLDLEFKSRSLMACFEHSRLSLRIVANQASIKASIKASNQAFNEVFELVTITEHGVRR